MPPRPATSPKSLPTATRPSSRLRCIVLTTTLATLVGTFVALGWSSVTPKIHAQVQKHRILRELQSVPSLHLHFTVKRDSMRVYGETEFDAFVNTRVTTSSDGGSSTVSFDGVASFTQGFTTHNHTLVDGIAYYTTQTTEGGTHEETVACLSPSVVPPVNDVLSAINSATYVSSVDGIGHIDCAPGHLLHFRFADDSFALCSAPTNATGKGFDILGSDLEIQVRYLAEPVAITAPPLQSSTGCEKLPETPTVSTSTLALLTGTGSDFANRLLVGSDESLTFEGSSCSCKGPKRPCLFIHGADQKIDNPELLDTFEEQFGKIHKHAPCCSSVKFAQIDTRNYGWNDDRLQQKVCDFSLSRSNSSDLSTKIIRDTVIVTYSMGNLIAAGAIATGKCSLAKSSEWVAITGPMLGSMASDVMQRICGGLKVAQDVTGVAVSLFGQCPPTEALKSMAYKGEDRCSPKLKAQYDAAQIAYKASATAALCSGTYSGLVSKDLASLALLGVLIPHKSKKNDGVVEYKSCVADLPADKFNDHYNSRFYKAHVNHLDAAFRNGDALFDNTRKPVKWFECLL